MVALLVTLLGCEREFGIAEDDPPWENTEVFEQASATRSDVLFVVDNSESMEAEQDALATNFPAFLQWFEGSEVDYHIGVVSTDMDDPEHSGLLRESQGVLWLEPDTPDAPAVFAEMTRLGIDGSSEERGREAVYTALELRGAANAGFRRDDAYLNVVVVSDEDDKSGDDRISQRDFVRYLLDLQSDTVRATFSAIVSLPRELDPDRCNPIPALDYIEVVQAVGGMTWSICDEDWLPLINELGFVTIGLRREFRLAFTPDPATLVVAIDGREMPATTWTHDPEANAVTFLGDPPPTGSEVVVRYFTTDEQP